MKDIFGTYTKACEEGDGLLFDVGKPATNLPRNDYGASLEPSQKTNRILHTHRLSDGENVRCSICKYEGKPGAVDKAKGDKK